MKLSKYSTFIGTVAIMAVAIVHIRAQSSPNPSATVSARNMIHHAKGTFEVTLKPLPLETAGGAEKLARMSSDKKFDGDLVGTGRGEMLSAGTEVNGSAGYVALERVVGTLECLRLHDGDTVLRERTEGDPRCQHMTFGCHERE